MALRVGDKLLRPLDDDEIKAYVLSAVIFREREGGRMHSDQLHNYMTERYPNLQIDYETVRDTLHALVKDGILIREVIVPDDAIYGLNPEYFEYLNG